MLNRLSFFEAVGWDRILLLAVCPGLVEDDFGFPADLFFAFGIDKSL
jgi:hypothetical protein